MNKLASPRIYAVPTAPALRTDAHQPARRTGNARTRPDNRTSNRPDNRPASRPGENRPVSTRPPNHPEFAPVIPQALAPVRVIRVGQPGLDHPLRPVTEPEELTVGDPTQVAATVVRAAVEVIDGRRSLTQIRGWLTPQVALQLAERTRLELAVPSRESSSGPIRIRKVHLVRFGDRAEATVILDMPERTRAAAARLEARQGAWRVSVLEIA